MEGQDLTPMVGKMVEINGAVTEKDGKYSIAVASVAESKK